MGLEANGLFILLVNFEVGGTDAHILALVEVSELVVQDLCKPHLVAFVRKTEL